MSVSFLGLTRKEAVAGASAAAFSCLSGRAGMQYPRPGFNRARDGPCWWLPKHYLAFRPSRVRSARANDLGREAAKCASPWCRGASKWGRSLDEDRPPICHPLGVHSLAWPAGDRRQASRAKSISLMPAGNILIDPKSATIIRVS